MQNCMRLSLEKRWESKWEKNNLGIFLQEAVSVKGFLCDFYLYTWLQQSVQLEQ